MVTVSKGDKTKSVDPIESGRFHVCLYMLLFVGIGLTVSALRPWGWLTATGLTVLVAAVVIGYIIMRRDAFGAKFMAACLAAGFVELLADWYIITIDRSLVYMPGGPFIWLSPLYMPFAWTGNLFIFGVLGRWFDGRWGLAAATIVTGLLGGITLPYWEFIAKYAGYWYYRDTIMLGPVPYYIIFGEFFITAALPLTFRVVKRVNWTASIGTGTIFGLWIFLAYRFGIQIFG